MQRLYSKKLPDYLQYYVKQKQYSYEFMNVLNQAINNSHNPMHVIRIYMPEYANTVPKKLDDAILDRSQKIFLVLGFLKKMISPQQFVNLKLHETTILTLFTPKGLELLRFNLITPEQAAQISTFELGKLIEKKYNDYHSMKDDNIDSYESSDEEMSDLPIGLEFETEMEIESNPTGRFK